MPAVYLLSAGLDSAVALAKCQETDQGGLAITFDYGQRAARQEIARAAKLAVHYGLQHKVIDLEWLGEITSTALVNRDSTVPAVAEADLDKTLDVTLATAQKVWVPNRNGLFVNIAAAYAESMGLLTVVTGFNAEEAATFPDNSPQFVAASNQALAFSTLNQVKLFSPTQNLNKIEIVEEGLRLKIPWHYLWSCYHGEDIMCGKCESCQRLKRALRAKKCNHELNLLFPVEGCDIGEA